MFLKHNNLISIQSTKLNHLIIDSFIKKRFGEKKLTPKKIFIHIN